MKAVSRNARWLVPFLLLAVLATASAGAPERRSGSKDAVGCSRVYDSGFNDTHFAYTGCAHGGGGCYDCYYNRGGVLSECYESPDGTQSLCWETDYQTW